MVLRSDELRITIAKKLTSGSELLLLGTVLVAFFLVIFQAPAVFLKVGQFSLSVYATITAATLLVASSGLQIAAVLFASKISFSHNSPRDLFQRLRVLSPLILLTFFAAIWLLAMWRLEGAQNLLALIILVFGIFAFSLQGSSRRQETVVCLFLWVSGVVSVVFVIFTVFELPGFANRQFAMIMLIPLSIAAVRKEKNWFDLVSPFLFSFAILLSQSRTAAVIAVILVAVHVFLSTRKTPKKFWGPFFAASAAITLMVLAFFGPRILESFIGIETGVEDRELLGTSGRLRAWTEFLSLLDHPFAWFIGIGTGGSMRYGAESIAFFPHPHNEYLRFLVDLGIVGLLLLIAGSLALLIVFGRDWKHDRPLTRAGFLLIFALGLMSTTDGPLYSSFVIVPSAMILGFGLGEALRNPRPEALT